MEKVIVQSLAGVGPDIFDCFGAQNLEGYVRSGIAMDVTDELKAAGIDVDKDVWRVIRPYFILDGRVYGLPNSVVDALFFNKKIFDDMKIPYPANKDWTWQEFIALAQQLTVRDEDGRVRQYGFCYDSWAWKFFLFQWGGRMYSDDGTRCTLDSPQAIAAVQFIHDLIYKYKVMASPQDLEAMAQTGGWGSSSIKMLGSGRAAMALGGRWWLCTLRNYEGLRLGAVQSPHGPQRTCWGYGRATLINRNSPNRAAALRFLLFMTSKDYNVLDHQQADGMPPMIKYATDGNLTNPKYPQESYHAVFRDAMYLGEPEFISSFVNAQTATDIVSRQLDFIMRDQKTVEAGLKDAVREIHEERDKRLRREPLLKERYDKLVAAPRSQRSPHAQRGGSRGDSAGGPAVNKSLRALSTASLFIAPNFLGFVVFTAGPVVYSLFASFTNSDLTKPGDSSWIGLENYHELLADKRFWLYFINTLYLMLAIPLAIFGSLAIALLLNQKLRGIVVFRTLFYLPTITAGVAIMILWKALLNPQFGIVNSVLGTLLHAIGLGGVALPGWLGSTQNLLGLNPEYLAMEAKFFGLGAKDAIIMMGVWTAIGGNNMLLYLAALANVSPDLIEAAHLDGAGRWATFRHVIWPQLAPTTFFITVMSIIGGLQAGFEQARIMTNGGPADTTKTLSFYIYEQAFRALSDRLRLRGGVDPLCDDPRVHAGLLEDREQGAELLMKPETADKPGLKCRVQSAECRVGAPTPSATLHSALFTLHSDLLQLHLPRCAGPDHHLPVHLDGAHQLQAAGRSREREPSAAELAAGELSAGPSTRSPSPATTSTVCSWPRG